MLDTFKHILLRTRLEISQRFAEETQLRRQFLFTVDRAVYRVSLPYSPKTGFLMKGLFFSWFLGILCVSGSVDGEFRFNIKLLLLVSAIVPSSVC